MNAKYCFKCNHLFANTRCNLREKKDYSILEGSIQAGFYSGSGSLDAMYKPLWFCLKVNLLAMSSYVSCFLNFMNQCFQSHAAKPLFCERTTLLETLLTPLLSFEKSGLAHCELSRKNYTKCNNTSTYRQLSKVWSYFWLLL